MFRYSLKSFSGLTASLLGSLVLLSSLTIASAQTVKHKPLPTEELEKYGDSPVYVWRAGLSPRRVSQLDAFASIQVNVTANGLNITGDAANEPSICVDPTNGSKMAIGWRLGFYE